MVNSLEVHALAFIHDTVSHTETLIHGTPQMAANTQEAP